MGIQPSLFMIDTTAFLPLLEKYSARFSFSCTHLHIDKTLSAQSCWQRFTNTVSGCCDFCSAGTEAPLRLSTLELVSPILFEEAYLSKKMYLWAKMHRDDEFSWTCASVVDDDFWRLWSLLTLRTIHITADEDRRGMCGFLTTQELQRFVEVIATVALPVNKEDIEELDMFGSEEEFSNLQYLLNYSKDCIKKGLGLAWIHDFV